MTPPAQIQGEGGVADAPAFTLGRTVIHVGDCRETLKALPAKSVHCVVTSPPYYGLRDYGLPPSLWGGDAMCDHEWGDTVRGPWANEVSGPSANVGKNGASRSRPKEAGTYCQKCGAWRGCLGLEPTVEMFIENMVDVFRGVWRVLRDDGTLFLNVGDSYAGSGKGPTGVNGVGNHETRQGFAGQQRATHGYKPKDLMMIPARLVLALQADGWWLRSDIAWCKTAPMPECLIPETRVFIKNETGIHQVTLDDVMEAGEPYPLILTPTGWKRILNAWETVKDEAVVFDAAKVSTVTCSPEHLWPVSHDRRRVVIHEKPASELRDKGYRDYLLHHTIDEWLDGTQDECQGQKLDYELGWLLGLYAAEGGFGEVRGFRCKFTVHENEPHLLDRVEGIVGRRFGATVNRRNIQRYATLRFSNEAWYNLARMVVSGKSTTKSLNLDVVLNAPADFRQGLWDGYIEGDGSDRERGVTAISASMALRDGMTVVASSIGLITSKRQHVQHDNRTGQTYVSHQLWTPYVTHRKKKKESTSRQLTIRNKRTVPGPHRMIDLEVEGGLFLIEDGLVTHNSVTDRPTNAWEHIFLLTKRERYYYDAEAVRERSSGVSGGGWSKGYAEVQPAHGAMRLERPADNGTRNLWNYWPLGPEPLAQSHYAAFPTEIPRRAILAGTSERGACPACGSPWKRKTEDTAEYAEFKAGRERMRSDALEGYGLTRGKGNPSVSRQSVTTGWAPSCKCGAGEPVPATVLDIFGGSGTSGMVANRLQRNAILCELNPAYAEMARRRIVGDLGMLADVTIVP